MDLLSQNKNSGRTPARTCTVTDLSALERLASWRGMFEGVSHVNLELCGLGKEELNRWQSAVNRQLTACGCKEGSFFVASSLLGYGAFLGLHASVPVLSVGAKLSYGICVALVAGAVGKLLGLLRARRILGKLVSQLSADYASALGSARRPTIDTMSLRNGAGVTANRYGLPAGRTE
jgi:hypothetical protein